MLLVIALTCGAVPAALAEFVVNLETQCTQDDAAVDLAPDGSFVITWHGLGGCSGTAFDDVRGRRYGADGLALGNEFTVNSGSDVLISNDPPEVGIAADGSFVIVFEATDGVRARRYDAAGTPLGGDFLASTPGTNTDREDVAVAPDGSFVIGWSDQVTETISARRFDATGAPLGPAFLVANVANGAGGARVGVAADGRFVVGWGDAGTVFAQRYDAAGSPDGAILQLNAGGFVGELDLGMAADGTLAAVWSAGNDVRGRRFDGAGTPLGGEFTVATGDMTPRPAIDVAGDGAFVVGYHHAGGDGDGRGVFVRHYDASGAALGPVAQANAFETGEQKDVAVGIGPAGRSIAVWDTEILDGSETGVVAQRYLDGFVDQPVAASQLTLQRRNGKETLVLLSKDPLIPLPPPGSADDPATGAPGGLVLELFSPADGLAQLDVPPGLGKPGWSVLQQPLASRYTFVNAQAPAGPSVVKSVVWKASRVFTAKQGRVFKVKASELGLALTGPQTAVAVRVTVGTRRFCALFDGPTIRRDEADRFIAKNTPASGLADCRDDTLTGLP